MPKGPQSLIEEFQQEYDAALQHAEKAAELTATDSWGKLFCEFVDQSQKTRGFLAADLERTATDLRNQPLDEDAVKDLKDTVKKIVERCDDDATFDRQTVSPIRGTVAQLHKLIAEYESKASAAASKTPLIDSGLPDAMADAISRVPKAQWSPRVGVVQISGRVEQR